MLECGLDGARAVVTRCLGVVMAKPVSPAPFMIPMHAWDLLRPETRAMLEALWEVQWNDVTEFKLQQEECGNEHKK